MDTKKHTPHARSIIGGGIAAGLIAGVVMGMFAMIVAALQPGAPGFWGPMKLIAATFLGASAVQQGGIGAVLLGMMLHLFTASMWGVVFSAITARLGTGGTAITGLLYGAVVFALMTYLVLPWANPLMFRMISQGWFFLYHLAYGLTLGLAAPVRADMERRHAARRHLTPQRV